MSLLATTTLAALLVANPGASDADRIAASGGFLLGNAHRCGIEESRVVRDGGIIHDLIVAAAADSNEADDATQRYATFFVVSAYPDQSKEKVLASCKVIDAQLRALEQHKVPEAQAQAQAQAQAEPKAATIGGGERTSFRTTDGD